MHGLTTALWLTLVAAADPASPAAPPDQTVKVALISTAGVVIAALLGGLFALRSRGRHSAVDGIEEQVEVTGAMGRQYAFLMSEVRDARHEQAATEDRNRELAARVNALERFLWMRSYDPEKIKSGGETDRACQLKGPRDREPQTPTH